MNLISVSDIRAERQGLRISFTGIRETAGNCIVLKNTFASTLELLDIANGL